MSGSIDHVEKHSPRNPNPPVAKANLNLPTMKQASYLTQQDLIEAGPRSTTLHVVYENQKEKGEIGNNKNDADKGQFTTVPQAQAPQGQQKINDILLNIRKEKMHDKMLLVRYSTQGT